MKAFLDYMVELGIHNKNNIYEFDEDDKNIYVYKEGSNKYNTCTLVLFRHKNYRLIRDYKTFVVASKYRFS